MGIQSYLRAIPAAFATGATPYLTVFLLGLGVQQGWIKDPSPVLLFLSAWWIMLIAALLYILEKATTFLPPAIGTVANQVWEIGNAVMAPLLGALVGIATANGDASMGIPIALTSAVVASVPRLTKFAANAALELPGVPFRKLGLSVIIDAVIAALLGLYTIAIQYPILLAVVGVGTLVFTGFLVYELGAALRWIGFHLSAFWTRVVSWFPGGKKSSSEILPSEHLVLIDHQKPEIAVGGIAQTGIRGANWQRGYLCSISGRLAFTYKPFLGGHRLWQVELERVNGVYLHRQVLFDTLDIYYKDVKDKQRRARLVFLKDKDPLVHQMAEKLSARVTADTMTRLGDGIADGSKKVASATAAGLQQGIDFTISAANEVAGGVEQGIEDGMKAAGSLVEKAKDKLTRGE